MIKPLLLTLVLLGQAQTRDGILTGRLLLQDGMPAANVRVAVVSVDEGSLSNIAQTDNEGRFRLENVSPGRYYLSAGPVSFPTYYPGVFRTESPTIVNVTSGATLNDLNFTLQRVSTGVKINGTVVREGPLAGGAPLQVALSGSGGLVQVASAGADGKFEFANVLPGRYSVGLDPPKPHFRQGIAVGDQDIDVKLLPRIDVVVLGTMRVPNDAPRPKLTLTFENATQKFSGTFSANGTVSIELPPGEYRLITPEVPAGYSIQSIHSSTKDLLTESLVIRDNDSPLILVSLGSSALIPLRKVSGRITGAIPANAKVSLSGSAMMDAPEVPVNPDGSFEVSQLLPGSYSMKVRPSGPGVRPMSFQIGDADVTNLEYAIPEARTIRGRLSPESGVAPGRTIFTLSDPQAGERLGTFLVSPAADGTFSIALPAGDYMVQLLMLVGSMPSKMMYGAANLSTQPMRIPATGQLEEFVLTFPR